MSLFTGLSLSDLQARYTEARAAYHALLIGQQVVSLGAGDKRLTFTAGEQQKLSAYLRQLQTAILIAQGGTANSLYAKAAWTR